MQNIFDSAVQITDTEITDTEGGDFVHKGTSKSGESCPRGKVVQFLDDDGNVTYLCKHCKRTWIGESLGV